MASSSAPSVDYDGAPSVLIFGERPAAIEEASAAAASLGARVAAALPLADAADRLGRQASIDAVMIELASDGGAALDALLDRIDALSADDIAAVIAMPAALIDPVLARIGSRAVQLLCDPDRVQRAGALGIALSARRSFLHDPNVEDDAERLARLSDEVGRIARALAEMAEREPHARANAAHDRSSSYRAEQPLDLAPDTVRRAIRLRRMREQFFDASLFADPAWDMLLDLMAARLERQRVAVSSLCIAASVPATTALRWIRAMTDRGLFIREADPHDARRVFIALSDGAAAAMGGYFEAVRKLGAAAA